MWNRKVFVRIVEMLLCVACVIALRVTDDESTRVFHYLRNRSREWSLLNNVTWGTIGAALAMVTCGGYVIVTMGLLVAAATGELRGRKTELLLLGLGVVLFGIVGALSLASIDSVPEDLIDNAAVLGALCLLTALVFIADLLMRSPGTKKKHDGTTQTFADKDIGKSSTTNVKSEKESGGQQQLNGKLSKDSEKANGIVNDNFEKSDVPSDDRDHNENFEENAQLDRDQRIPRPRSTDIFEEERNRKFEDVEKQLREYTRNFESERSHRDYEKRRESNETSKNETRKDFFENGRYRLTEKETRGTFQNEDIYSHPLDETNTPPFPTNLQARSESIFAKIINPGVKIMKVERNHNDKFDDYRFSDYGQYDNVPTRMRGPSSGILKKNRDVSFGISSPPKAYEAVDGTRDEIELLEECFDALRTSTGTQTGSRADRLHLPSSPTDPGYVRHTANNWPRNSKSKHSDSNLENGKDQ